MEAFFTIVRKVTNRNKTSKLAGLGMKCKWATFHERTVEILKFYSILSCYNENPNYLLHGEPVVRKIIARILPYGWGDHDGQYAHIS